jgi:NO-binding membrane sensor protein with MHYT domain
MSVIYDPALVLLSIFVAIIGSLTGLALTFGYDAPSMFFAPKSLLRGAIIIGGSIWSMHFIAMLAVKFPVAISYNSRETLLSLGAAILFTGIGLAIASSKSLNFFRIPIAGVLMGSGIAVMHYLGMRAISGCGITFDYNGVALSIAVAILASAIALWFAFRTRGAFETMAAGVVLGLAIAGMHYTGMYATSFYPAAGPADIVAPAFSQTMLALLVAAATLLICGIYLFLFSSMLVEER